MQGIISSIILKPFSYYSQQDLQFFHKVKHASPISNLQSTPQTQQYIRQNKIQYDQTTVEQQINSSDAKKANLGNSKSVQYEGNNQKISKVLSNQLKQRNDIKVSQFVASTIVEQPEESLNQPDALSQLGEALSDVQNKIKELSRIVDSKTFQSIKQAENNNQDRRIASNNTAYNRKQSTSLLKGYKDKYKSQNIGSKKQFKLKGFLDKLNYTMFIKIDNNYSNISFQQVSKAKN